MSEKDVNDHRSQQRKTERHKSVDEQQDSGHNLEECNSINVMSCVQHAEKLRDGPRGHWRRGEKMQHEIEPEKQKYRAQKDASNSCSNSH